MNVGQVTELAKEWVELEGRKTPGFHGAYLLGSILGMPENASFATYRDVDLEVVVPDGSGHDSGRKNEELPYKGLILEVGFQELYRSPEVVLADPGMAPCFAVNSILSDPTGMLRALHEAVAKEYTRREWVSARCVHEKMRFWERFEPSYQTDSPAEIFYRVARAMCYVAGIVAVAHLRQPTHRRCLILMRELLEPRGKSGLCEKTLRILGYSKMSRAQVESCLQEAARAFDRAVEVHHSPSRLGFKLHPHVRPYLVQAAQEMIDEGYHREAMWWISGFHYGSNAAIQNDAPESEKSQYQMGFGRLLDDLGWTSSDKRATRLEQARALADEVFQVADEIVAQNPEIVD